LAKRWTFTLLREEDKKAGELRGILSLAGTLTEAEAVVIEKRILPQTLPPGFPTTGWLAAD